MPKLKREREEEPSLQITTFIDVMTTLLCAFVAVCSTNVKELQLGVQVPGESTSRATTAETPIEITILKDGTVQYNRSPLDSKTSEDLPELKDKLKRTIDRFAEQPVVIRPNADTRHDRVVAVLNACSYARVKRLTFGENAGN